MEFALILPLLLVLLLGIADLGRVFAAAITVEAASRNGAEAAAQEYLQVCQLPGRDCSDGLLAGDYVALHDHAREVSCGEAERLPYRDAPSGDCTMPVIAVCVHDEHNSIPNGDVGCGAEAAGAPGPCSEMAAGWDPTRLGPDLPYVEVRMCYRFDPLIAVPLGDWGYVWIQKANHFTIANY